MPGLLDCLRQRSVREKSHACPTASASAAAKVTPSAYVLNISHVYIDVFEVGMIICMRLRLQLYKMRHLLLHPQIASRVSQ